MTDQRVFQEQRTLDDPPVDVDRLSVDPLPRWRERRLAGGTLRLLVVAAPAVAAAVVVGGAAQAWPKPSRTTPAVAWWLVVVAAATATIWVVGRLARRLLPLAALLQVSLAFPGPAPRRLWVGIGAGNPRSIDGRLAALRQHGLNQEPLRAATQAVVLLAAVGSRQWRTWSHAERVARYADAAAVRLGLTESDRDRLRWASLLHDIGILTVEPDIAGRARTLDGTEWKAIRGHPVRGSDLISPLRPWLGEWASAIDEHHERWDGYGYPRGLAGGEIGLGGRIVSVADAFEVMTAPWSYRPTTSPAPAREELTAEAGRQFDPQVVDAFVDLPRRRMGGRAFPYRLRADTPLLTRLRPPVTMAAVSAILVALALLVGLAPTRAPSRAAPIRAAAPAPQAADRTAPGPVPTTATPAPATGPTRPPGPGGDANASPLVAVLPRTVTSDYAMAVMTALDQVLGDAIRLLVANRGPDPAFNERLAAVYIEPELTRKRGVYGAETARALEVFRDNPGNPATIVDSVVSGDVQCTVLAVRRDFSALLDNPGRGPVAGFVALTPKVGRPDPAGQNPTAWRIVFDGVTADGAPPTNPC